MSRWTKYICDRPTYILIRRLIDFFRTSVLILTVGVEGSCGTWSHTARDWSVAEAFFLIPQSTALLEKLKRPQPLKKLSAFYGNRRLIITFTSARHLSLSWASSIQSVSPHPTSSRSTLILSSHLPLGLPSGLFPSGFPTKTLHTPLLSPIRSTCPVHLILLDMITRTILGEECGSLIL